MPHKLFRHIIKHHEFPDTLSELPDKFDKFNKFNELPPRFVKLSHRFTELEVVCWNYGWNWDRLCGYRRPACRTGCLFHSFPTKSSATKLSASRCSNK
jgi:hypothetical protein